jgi:hypothetical protein
MKITLTDAEKLDITFEMLHSLIIEKDYCQGSDGLDDAKCAYALMDDMECFYGSEISGKCRRHLEEARKYIALHF